MKLARALLDEEARLVDIGVDGVVPRTEADLSELFGVTVTPARGEPVSGAKLLAPLRPPKIVAVGLNYLDHIRESGLDRPSTPLLFTKFTTSVIGNGDSIEFDRSLTQRVDWEVELAVVIGASLRNATEADAAAAIFGYTVANDVSARDLQFSDGQWVRAKSLDTFCPLGPVVVTADEVPDPQALGLRTRVNGEVMQESSTSEMLFDGIGTLRNPVRESS